MRLMRFYVVADWGRPPNFLLVDFYHVSDESVFKTAARFNGVPYRGQPSAAVKSFEPPAFVTRVITFLKRQLARFRPL